MSLAFLSKKNFNPSNIANQKKVWEAQQRKIQNAKQIQEREEQLKREREDEDLARAIGGRRGGDEASLRFMYDAPPGTNKDEDEKNDVCTAEVVSSSDLNRELSIYDRHPGDDDAAAKFRLMLAAYYNKSSDDENAKSDSLQQNNNEPRKELNASVINNENPDNSLPTVDTRTQLEKAVGKRNTNQALTLQEQIARFPQLKNAPMAKGMNVTNVHVKFNPMSGPLRNVRCLNCGIWGHQKGDRECKLTWNPFEGGGPSGSSGACVEIKEELNQKKKRDGDTSSSSSDSYDRRHRRDKKKRHRHESSHRHRKSHKSKRCKREISR